MKDPLLYFFLCLWPLKSLLLEENVLENVLGQMAIVLLIPVSSNILPVPCMNHYPSSILHARLLSSIPPISTQSFPFRLLTVSFPPPPPLFLFIPPPGPTFHSCVDQLSSLSNPVNNSLSSYFHSSLPLPTLFYILVVWNIQYTEPLK